MFIILKFVFKKPFNQCSKHAPVLATFAKVLHVTMETDSQKTKDMEGPVSWGHHLVNISKDSNLSEQSIWGSPGL